MTWYQIEADGAGPLTERLLTDWPEAPIERLDLLTMILDTAREQVIAYAPTLPDGDPIPDRLAYAQLQQAVNLWNASTVSGGGEIGVEQFTFTPRPLDKTIRTIIRPVSGFSFAI